MLKKIFGNQISSPVGKGLLCGLVCAGLLFSVCSCGKSESAPKEAVQKKILTPEEAKLRLQQAFAKLPDDDFRKRSLQNIDLENSGGYIIDILDFAVSLNDLALVQYLTKQKSVDINGGTIAGCTVLAHAAERGYEDIVSALIQAGANVNTNCVCDYGTALIHAINELQRVDKGKHNHIENVVSILIQAGANVNAKGERGETALMAAAMVGNENIFSELIKAGANVNAKGERGETALMAAAAGGNENIVSTLIKAGADVNAKNKDGDTVLMAAAAGGNENIVSTLIKAGADVNAKNNRIGYNALMIALHDMEMIARRDDLDKNAERRRRNGLEKVISSLIKAGADVNTKGQAGETALLLAISSRNEKIVLDLIKAGADVNTKLGNASGKIKGGFTELMAAAMVGNENIFSALIKAGADVNAKSDDGFTVLMAAAAGGNEKIVSDLIKVGADVNAKSDDGTTALSFASKRGFQDIVTILKNAGAKK